MDFFCWNSSEFKNISKLYINRPNFEAQKRKKNDVVLTNEKEINKSFSKNFDPPTLKRKKHFIYNLFATQSNESDDLEGDDYQKPEPLFVKTKKKNVFFRPSKTNLSFFLTIKASQTPGTFSPKRVVVVFY